MKILEILNPNTNLTNVQQLILITIKISPTVEVAYKNTNLNEKMVYSRNLLRNFGFIKVGNNQAQLTDQGLEVMMNYDLIDETGNLTETAQDLYDKFNQQNKQNESPDNLQ